MKDLIKLFQTVSRNEEKGIVNIIDTYNKNRDNFPNISIKDYGANYRLLQRTK